MKNKYSVILAVCFFVSLVFLLANQGKNPQWKGKIEYEDGIKVIKNPREPINNNARREIHLKEMMRIRDDGKKIIFRWPENIVIDNHENIYFLSSPHLFKYDKNGNFIYKIIEAGQGPGEADSRLRKRFSITDDEIVIRAISPLKVMKFNLDGVLKEEIKLIEPFGLFRFVGSFRGKIYIVQLENPWLNKGKTGYVNFPTNIYEFSPDFEEHKKIYTFPVKFYYKINAWFGQAFLEFAIKDIENLFVVHTSEYKIVRFNLKSKQIEDVITRKFKRTKRPKRKKQPGFTYGPDREYYQDIQKLLIFGDKLWAITSEKNEDNDWLVDVYDMEGKFIDSFFLCFPDEVEPKRYQNIQLITWKNFLFSVDQDKEGYYSIAKYSIDDLYNNDF